MMVRCCHPRGQAVVTPSDSEAVINYKGNSVIVVISFVFVMRGKLCQCLYQLKMRICCMLARLVSFKSSE